jgi:hypothetical protein
VAGATMAWEELWWGPVRGMTGDLPFDEIHSALDHIRRGYVERWGRNPYFAELLYVLRITVAADPPAYVADDVLPNFERLAELVGAGATFEYIDPGDYVAGLDEETGDFLVFPREIPTGRRPRDVMVLRGQVIENGENSVLCPYSILSPAITDGMAKSLIRLCVLQNLLDYNIIDGDLTIRFERTA